MNLRLLRTGFTEKSTTGELYLDDTFFSFTLELVNKDGLHGSCISAGTYRVLIDFSERFQRAMPRLVNVPFRQGILIHYGNIPSDTEGCILVGDTHDPHNPDFIGESRAAFNRLFLKMASAASEGISIDIQGGYRVPDAA